MTATSTVSNIRKLRVTIPTSAAPVTKDARLRTVPSTRDDPYIEFVFPFTPIEITYDALAPEWVEIDRPLNTPLVDLKGYNLMKVNLRFLVAVPFDGIEITVDNDIRTLRSIANSNDPVSFINMDRMLTNPFNISRLKSDRPNAGFFFRIAEMSINSIRRNLFNEITSAEVTMTLQETANPPIRKIYFETVDYLSSVTPSTKEVSKPNPITGIVPWSQNQLTSELTRTRIQESRQGSQLISFGSA